MEAIASARAGAKADIALAAMSRSLQSLKLRPELVAACKKQGFRDATPIQALAIPLALQGKDLIVEAKTGSGKTLAYGLPLLQSQPQQERMPEHLILTPTRELAMQVQASLSRTAGTLPRRVVALTGGAGMDRQIGALRNGAHIVVATMGRLEELLSRQQLSLDCVRTLVLDEVDELLQGGFSGQLAALISQLPSRRQTLLFSATVSHDIERVAQQFMQRPQRLQLEDARELPTQIEHRVLRTTVKARAADLAEFLRHAKPYQALIFCGTRHEAEEVCAALSESRLQAEFFHGELSQPKRQSLMGRFRDGDLPILVATDLAARGLDLPGVDMVVNHSLPEGLAEYLHRAGRTGRAGRPGTVVSMLIEQQLSTFTYLKETLEFKSVEVRHGHLLVRPLKSREERDLQYRRLPRGQVPVNDTGRPKRRRG